jgi:hypothetical protein
MRIILAVAFVAIVVASGRAQAPSEPALPMPLISFEKHIGHIEFVRVKFADGSQLQADKLETAQSSAGETVRFRGETQPFARTRVERVQVEVSQPNGEWRQMPFPLEMTLSGNVRLTLGGQ